MRLVLDGEIWQRQRVGGISRVYNEVLPRLCDLDPSLTVTVITDGPLKQAPPDHAGITHHSMPAYNKVLRPGRLWLGPTRRLKRATRDWWTRPDRTTVWQPTYYTPPMEWPGRFALLVHDLIEERFPDFFDLPRHHSLRQLKQICGRKADLVLCVSKTTQQDVVEFLQVPEAKTQVVTLAASQTFRQLPQAELSLSLPLPGDPFFLYVGNRSAYKNFEFLLRSYAAWPQRREIALVVVGSKFNQELAVINEMGISDRVFSYQNVDDATLCKLYNLAQAFIYPSLHEGFGIPLLEAMACGCPIVASRIPSTLEVAGQIPFYFDPRDTDELQAALAAASEPNSRPERGRAGTAHARGYTWDQTARQFLAGYRQVAGLAA